MPVPNYPYTAINPYITVDELVEELKAATPDVTTDEGQLDSIKYNLAIERASRLVDEYLQTDFYFHDYSTVPLVLDQFSKGVFSDKIFLPHQPIISLGVVTRGTDTLTLNTDFAADLKQGILYSMIGNWLPSRPDNLISIYGTFGYPQPGGDPETVPTGIPGKVIIATRVAAAFLSGDARKEFFPIDGEGPISVAIQTMPKTFFLALGDARMPILT
jgi:hypothetical protein